MNTATTKTRSKITVDENIQLDVELSKIGIFVMGVVAGLIGIWAAACMVGGLLSNGPLAFVSSWFGAVIGG